MARTLIAFSFFVMASCIVIGCGSSDVAATMTPEARFAKAKALFAKEDYLEAISDFTVITLQYQGSAVAAEAQYYLGECRFERGEYLLAAFEYAVLKRSYAASPLVADAQYKLALSYYKLSPKSSLDQQYTRKAIDEFQTFAEYYSSNPKAQEAGEKIKELNLRLAKKQYETAFLYTKMDFYKAALAYYDLVIEKYHDTEYAPLSYIAKAELLLSKNKVRDAKVEIEAFLSRYANSVLRSRGEELKRKIDQELESGKKPGAKESAGPGSGGQTTPTASAVPDRR